MLGTFVEISIKGDLDRESLLSCAETAFKSIKNIEETMSFHIKDSELSILNRSASNSPVKVSRDLFEVLRTGLAYSRLSDGLFDLTIGCRLVLEGKLPDHGVNFSSNANWSDIVIEDDTVFFNKPLLIDLGGIAKGYAVDRGFESIREIESTKDRLSKIVVNAGGDLRVWPWKGEAIAIRIPKEPYTKTTDVTMQNISLATSGPYFGGSIIGGREIISNELSVSVFSRDCIDADALTKIYSLHPTFTVQGIEHKKLTINRFGSKIWGP